MTLESGINIPDPQHWLGRNFFHRSIFENVKIPFREHIFKNLYNFYNIVGGIVTLLNHDFYVQEQKTEIVTRFSMNEAD